MNFTITLISDEGQARKQAEAGTNLFALIRGSGIQLYAPCGGAGTCGKCRVIIEGTGTVMACQYFIQKDIVVHLPNRRMTQVMTAQYEFMLKAPFAPGPAAFLTSCPLGLAIDIGTTTMAYYLVSLLTGAQLGVRSEMNPQSGYGADVISRINHCMTHGDGLETLRRITLDSIGRQIGHFMEETGADRKHFTRLVIGGNTTMLHILAGVDPRSLALAPFTPVFTEHRIFRGEEMGLQMHPEGEVHLLPSVSAYVGADIVAGIASIELPGAERFLYIDIGTNGEIALVTPERIWCCATAAGPAFEGANISCGSGAFTGAISMFNGGGMATIADAPPVSICGSGLIDIMAFLVGEGLVDGEGHMKDPFVVSGREHNGIDSDIVVTPQDVREIQLAKGAIAAGITILLKRSGYQPDDIDRLVVAGGFGNYLNIENAMKIGLLPLSMIDRTIQVGNAAGTGALMALKSEPFLARLKDVIERSEYIELSHDEDFPMEFALNMGFPAQKK